MKKWKIIQSEDEIKGPAIYQEKVIISVGADAGDIEILKKLVTEKGGELAEPPERIKRMAESLGLQVIAFWANKTDPKTRIEDILEGNIRMQISDDE